MIAVAEGFEGIATFATLYGWVNGPAALDSGVVHRTPDGFGGDWSGEFSQTGGFRWLPFLEWNVSAGRPYRGREAHVNWAVAASSDARTNPLLFFNGSTGFSGMRLEAFNVRAMRNLVNLGSAAFPYAFNTFYTFKLTVYMDAANGRVRITQNDSATPLVDLTGVNTGGALDIDGIGFQGQNFQPIQYADDIVAYLPSVIVEIEAGSVAAGDAITIGTATMNVSDVDTAPRTNVTPSAGGAIARLIVDSWDRTTFADGAAVVGGTLVNTIARVPNAEYQGGFEPYSWPEFTQVVASFLVAPRWEANGTVNLTPVGSANNFENVDDAPPDVATYNEATTGLAQDDTYTTLTLPAGTAAIQAVCQRVACETFGAYASIESSFNDGSGSQTSADIPLPSPIGPAFMARALDSTDTAWGTTPPTSGTYILKP